MIEFEKAKDASSLLEEIDKRIERKRIDLRLVTVVFQACEKYEGKPITKRIATAVEKALPTYTVNYNRDYGMFHIRIWGNGIPYNNRFSSLIGYDSDICNPIVNMMCIRDYNKCHTLEAGRIKNLETGRAIVQRLVTRWNRALSDLKRVHRESEAYGLEYDFDTKS